MVLSRSELIDLYRKRATRYDFTANLYYLLGFREWAYRKKAVAAIGLGQGDTVVEIGCGTGLNFALLQRAVGPNGSIVGVDVTDKMLAQAQRRITDQGWSNVELVHCDAAVYEFPQPVDGILSTFALTLVPEFDDIIRRGALALSPGKRWVVADLRLPTGVSGLLTPILMPIFRPFGVTQDLSRRHPWESIAKYLNKTHVDTSYLGFVYVALGERAPITAPETAHEQTRRHHDCSIGTEEGPLASPGGSSENHDFSQEGQQ